MAKYLTYSEKDTKKLAQKLAEKIKAGVIALTGELGAGKTTFVQGFAKGLGNKEKIISPTFVIQRIHKIPNSKKILHHIDLYRLEDKKDFKQLGLTDLFFNPDNIVLIEWAEKAKDFLPKNTTYIEIIKENENTRVITVS